MSPNQTNVSPAAATQAPSTTNNNATDNTSVERLLVPETTQRDASEEADVVIPNDRANTADKNPTKRKSRAVKGKGRAPAPAAAKTRKGLAPPSKVLPSEASLRETVGEEAFLGLGDDEEETSDSDEDHPLSQVTIKMNHNEILCKNIEVATLRGDMESVEMLEGLLHDEIVEQSQPERNARPLPKFKRNPTKTGPNPYAIPESSAVAPLALSVVAKKQPDTPSIPITQGGLTFMAGVVTSHADIGFTPFFNKNIRELRSPLPLTIFDKDWQERALTYHVEKRSKSDDTSNERVSRYSGLPYPNEWSQTYASWSMNHKTFHELLRDVYDLSVFAGWITIHKQHVDNLHKHHGFMPAFRYNMMTRANTFSHRVYDRNGTEMVPDISKFKTDIWQICYSQSQKHQELGFTDNPYAKGGIRENWDPLTGEERRAKPNHSYNQPFHSASHYGGQPSRNDSRNDHPHPSNHAETRGDASSSRSSGYSNSGFRGGSSRGRGGGRSNWSGRGSDNVTEKKRSG
ncbi:uncharacterized protein PGTG_20662 [Puccinia graminis f. sp. tritici CRL 75-36-700-3]|uniref:Uncharacterized protein n=1 Tax=Puccinia graminis f. sp. tritici (strain CRL 75-36-700-3 / race SCCL) TaxID=418459 RepID=H6QP92_PUCGT|nr:uncharacterized protein PGTG_20662 [Puccinia graminis f. sp. tritici CRL 75-36-700-3]EHS63566.1 hypothetical protein PGTG_20662 [Puccinia graminis f. sp. tritici CRL 75-36-700-3]